MHEGIIEENKVVKTSVSTMANKALQHWFCVTVGNCTVLTSTVRAGEVLEAYRVVDFL